MPAAQIGAADRILIAVQVDRNGAAVEADRLVLELIHAGHDAGRSAEAPRSQEVGAAGQPLLAEAADVAVRIRHREIGLVGESGRKAFLFPAADGRLADRRRLRDRGARRGRASSSCACCRFWASASIAFLMPVLAPGTTDVADRAGSSVG